MFLMNRKVVELGGTLSEELARGPASQVKETADRLRASPGPTKPPAAVTVEQVGGGLEEGTRDTIGVSGLGGYSQLRAALSGTSFAAPSLEPLIMALRDLGDAC
jgi:hypothetical protein